VSRTCEFHPWMRSGSLLAARPVSRSLDPCFPRARLTLARSGAPHAFRDLDLKLDRGPTCLPDTMTEGHAPAFRPLRTRSTLPRRERPLVPSGPMAFSVARRCASWGLAAFLGRSVKMPRDRFYNRRFASRAPVNRHHLWRLPAGRRGKTRRRSTSRPALEQRVSATLPWSAPDHLAVIRPPTTRRLTAPRRLRADRRPRLRRSAGWGRERRSFFG